MTEIKPKNQEGSTWSRLFTEMGPLLVFYAVYIKGNLIFDNEGKEIFYATGAFMGAFALAFAYSALVQRRIAPMLIITGVIVTIFGGLTLILQNKTFIFMKPTIVNLTFASILAGGVLTNRLFMKSLFNQAFQLTDLGWRHLTWRFVGFFMVLAVLNEIIWRNNSEEFWVTFKTFGVLPITLVFTFLQVFLILKHQLPQEDFEPEKTAENSGFSDENPPNSDTGKTDEGIPSGEDLNRPED